LRLQLRAIDSAAARSLPVVSLVRAIAKHPVVSTLTSTLLKRNVLKKAQCTKLAAFTHNAYARAISPVHTTADGDTVFVMAAGKVDTGVDSLGVLAADVVAKAIARAVLSAEPAYGLPAARSFK
jgi:L-aminopeptidase/D-esterase-like protein